MRPWENVSMDFVVALPMTQGSKYLVIMVVDKFSKMAHFMANHKTEDVSHVADLCFKEIIRL